jgi:hypothetical protein
MYVIMFAVNKKERKSIRTGKRKYATSVDSEKYIQTIPLTKINRTVQYLQLKRIVNKLQQLSVNTILYNGYSGLQGKI